jgi:putative glutamine amidotransferase
LTLASSFDLRRPFYEEAIARSGGRPILITPLEDDSDIEAVLDKVDALLLGGGSDVTPAIYGGEADNAGGTNRQRDEFEIRLILSAVGRNMPILGVCRGIQILNVAHGGTIRNLRDDENLSDLHGIDMDSFSAHQVKIIEGTHLARMVGGGEHQINSFHGQAVGVPGTDLRICAAAPDGVIEGIERADRKFVIGIQWHPEIDSLADKSALVLFEELVKQADAYRSTQQASKTASPPTTQPQDNTR